jgi:hypothetical protein
MAEYQDRFNAARYASDEGVSLTLDGAPESAASVTMPERLFSRAQQIASAYELHVLPVMDYYGEVRLDREQVRTLRDEFAFISAVAADPLLDSYLERARTLIDTCLRAPGSLEFVVKGP